MSIDPATDDRSLAKAFTMIPPVTKAEMVAIAGDDGRGWFDAPAESYVRMHQTSGTTGRPLVVRDTADDWAWWLDCWDHVLDAAAVTSADIAMMAFSFGPFIGFWTASDAMVRRGVMTVPGGGLSTRTRVAMTAEQRCTVVCCTPTYAMRMIAVAAEGDVDLAGSDVRVVIVAGEPGGSVPEVRDAIAAGFGAAVIDHAGGSEVGAWGYGRRDGAGLHVIETEFIAEILSFDSSPTGAPVQTGDTGELVLTGLGRCGGPAIRYRTGDVVRRGRPRDDDPFLFLPGGVLGRADDMVVIRGVNVFPSAVESIVRRSHPIEEYRVTVTRENEMDRLSVEIETDPDRAGELSRTLSDALALSIPVRSVAPETLPRFEAKARRWVDRRFDAMVEDG